MDWRLRIPKPIELTSDTPDAYVIEGTGPLPVAELLTPPLPKPPPPPEPHVDDRPFVWPPEWLVPGEATARYRQAWLIPGRHDDDVNGKVYVYLADAGNAIGTSHHNAGIIKVGKWAGYRLWAPRDTPDAMLHAIIDTGSPT